MLKFKNKEELEEMKNKQITITREEFVKTFMEAISDPFGDENVSAEDRAKMQFSMMMHGMLLLKVVEEKLFGDDDE